MQPSHVDPTIDVRDQFQSHVIDQRISRRRSIEQTGQAAAVAHRQMPTGHPDLFFNQIEVIEQPFRCGAMRSLRSTASVTS